MHVKEWMKQRLVLSCCMLIGILLLGVVTAEEVLISALSVPNEVSYTLVLDAGHGGCR